MPVCVERQQRLWYHCWDTSWSLNMYAGVWNLNPTEQRALICHILATSQPPTLDSLPCYDQSPAAAMTGGSLSSSKVSCEEMLCKARQLNISTWNSLHVCCLSHFMCWIDLRFDCWDTRMWWHTNLRGTRLMTIQFSWLKLSIDFLGALNQKEVTDLMEWLVYYWNSLKQFFLQRTSSEGIMKWWIGFSFAADFASGMHHLPSLDDFV